MKVERNRKGKKNLLWVLRRKRTLGKQAHRNVVGREKALKIRSGGKNGLLFRRRLFIGPKRNGGRSA